MVKYLNNNAKLKCFFGCLNGKQSVCLWTWFGGFLSLSSFYILFFVIINLVVILHV
jgi:hypothetical protein